MNAVELAEGLSKLPEGNADEVVAVARLLRVLRERIGLPIDISIIREAAVLASVVLPLDED